MIKENPTCHWCKRVVKDYGLFPVSAKTPDDMATIDHKISRFFRKPGQSVPKVLACNKCNQDRSTVEDRKYGKQHRMKFSPLAQIKSSVV